MNAGDGQPANIFMVKFKRAKNHLCSFVTSLLSWSVKLLNSVLALFFVKFELSQMKLGKVDEERHVRTLLFSPPRPLPLPERLHHCC